MRPRVVLIESMYDPAGEELLARHAEVQVLHDPTQGEIRAAVRGASAVAVGYPARLRGDAIREGSDLLVISTSGRGADAIDIPAATAQGVAVVNNPGLGTVPVSEHTVGLMLDLAKQITRSDIQARQGKGWAQRNQSTRIHLEGRTLGIIGCGQIGTEVARKCAAAFRMRVLVYDPYIPPSKAEAVGATWVRELAPLLREADFVSLHPELTEETRGMIGEAELRQMRREAFLINTARGQIVQQPALVRALVDNLILTPHVAGVTIEARRDLALSAAAQILQVLRGERPPHLVNPQVWERLERRLRAVQAQWSP